MHCKLSRPLEDVDFDNKTNGSLYTFLGVFTARIYDNHGQFDTYVDGGVLCNYPIQCYDGKSPT